ncbi:transcription initiation factor TFIID subunit 10-like [Ctenocephalides felis]|uniref:transcription initiation factor TFIID subunit 10-like n=1 Tax=Ctenocephalides felis TaxID=7515 RepID=UPI000E6E49FE|nr:transcription initiation factor TFIID subunit 10-like [Ctenocephalides felis]
MGENFAARNNQSRTNSPSTMPDVADGQNSGQPLSDFLLQLEDYIPTIPDSLTTNYLRSAGCESTDPRIIRLISLAAQKFISDVANDALQHCKTRSINTPANVSNSKNPKLNKDKKYTLTMEDLAPALQDYGISVKKPHYYV